MQAAPARGQRARDCFVTTLQGGGSRERERGTKTITSSPTPPLLYISLSAQNIFYDFALQENECKKVIFHQNCFTLALYIYKKNFWGII